MTVQQHAYQACQASPKMTRQACSSALSTAKRHHSNCKPFARHSTLGHAAHLLSKCRKPHIETLCCGLHHELAGQQNLMMGQGICAVFTTLAADQRPELCQHCYQRCQLVCWVIQMNEHTLAQQLCSCLQREGNYSFALPCSLKLPWAQPACTRSDHA